MSKKEETTSVAQVDIDLGDILGTGADTVMLANEAANKKPTVFSRSKPDTKFLDKPVEETTGTDEKPAEEETSEAATEATPTAEIETSVVEETSEPVINDDPLGQPGEELISESDHNKGGRPTALVTATKKLIEKGLLTPFVDESGNEEDLSKYTAEDFEELIAANFKNSESKVGENIAGQFFQSLPEELQYAYKYVSDGGQDIKGMFQALAQSQEVKQIDVTSEAGQKYAIRAYLSATNYGTPEEIEDEIYSLEDRGELEKKANQFKPKLDRMQEEVVNRRVAQQEQEAKQRAQQSQQYIDTVYSTLEKGDLNGLKLDNKTQNMLYAGLVQSNYPSMSGKQTNMLGHLLEKYQWQEPRHDLIAEALWLLADPDGYKNNVAKGTKQAEAQKTLRTLKTEQATKSAGSVREEPQAHQRKVSRGVQRPKKNFFGR
jgi:hypothetical protein